MKNLMFFLIFGILLVGGLSFSIVLAENSNGNGNRNQECVERDGACCRGENCTQMIVDCIEGLFPEFEGCDENCSPIWECEEIEDEDDEEDENGQVTKTKVTGNKTTFLPWQKRNESECPEGCKCRGAVVSCRTETGKTLTIEAGRSGNIITITIVKGEDDDEEPEDEEEDVEANTSLEIEQESRLITGGTRLKVKLSNGKKAEIKIMPDSAAERALERLRLKVCSSENNCTIELKEVPTRNENKAAYEIQAERHFKILSLFEAKARVKAQVDAETGEIIIVKKPWWAFLALEPEE